MAICLRSRFVPLSIASVNPKFPTFFHFTTDSTAAEQYYTHLQKNSGNIEKSLATVKAKLDPSCVASVMNRCLTNNKPMGLRFFIWAGIQSDYRHSSYMYNKACKLLGIRRDPQSIFNLIEGYRTDGCLVNLKTFKVILNLCRMAKLGDESLWVLRKMPEFNCQPDTTVYNVVIRIVCGKGEMDIADKLMKEMVLNDLYPDMITYVMMIKGFCDIGRLEDACSLIKDMKKHGCDPNTVIYSSLLDGICKFGTMERALELVGKMEEASVDCSPNVITYTSIIQSFCEKTRSMEALMIFDRMVARGCFPNRVTISTLINGLCKEGLVDKAYMIIDKIVKEGYVSESECYSSLIVSLLRTKDCLEAEKVIRKMLSNGLRPDGLACSIMIKQICLEGRVLDGFKLFDEIEKMGYLSSIDSEICSILLDGLCQEKHLVEAARVAKIMINKGIKVKVSYADGIFEKLKISKDEDILLYVATFAR